MVCSLKMVYFEQNMLQNIVFIHLNYNAATQLSALCRQNNGCNVNQRKQKRHLNKGQTAMIVDKKKLVNMTRKYHNHTLQANPWHHVEKTQNTNSHITARRQL